MKNNYRIEILCMAIALSCFVVTCFAEIPIYCPNEKTHLYNYQKDEIKSMEIVLAKDFIPINETIPQPKEADLMICPICKAPLNGYEYIQWKIGAPPPEFFIHALTLLTKDKKGDFLWQPYNITIGD